MRSVMTRLMRMPIASKLLARARTSGKDARMKMMDLTAA